MMAGGLRGVLLPGLVFAALHAPVAQAVGLGEVEVLSPLGRALDARLPLILDRGEDPESVRVRLLPLSAYESYGLQLPNLHPDGVSIQVETRGVSGYWLRLQSRNPVREPVLELLVEVSQGSTRIARSLTLLFDMPTDAPRAPMAPPPAVAQDTRVAAPPPAATLVQDVALPAAAAGNGKEYGPVVEGETLRSIAERVRPEPHYGLRRVMAALLLANPEGFSGRNRTPRVGSRLQVPDAQAMLDLDAATITAQVGPGRQAVSTSRRAPDLVAALEPAAPAPAAGVEAEPTLVPAMAQIERIELDLSAVPATPSIGRVLVLAETLQLRGPMPVAQPAPVASTASAAEAGDRAEDSGFEVAPTASGVSIWNVLFALLAAVGAVFGYRRVVRKAPLRPTTTPAATLSPQAAQLIQQAAPPATPPVRLVRSHSEAMPLPRPSEGKLQTRLQRLQAQSQDTLQKQKLALAAAYLDMGDEASARQLLDDLENPGRDPARRA